MRRNNKALYEKIMKNVAKEVKRVLNENVQEKSLYQMFIDELQSTDIPDYLDSCYGSENSDTWCYYANMAKYNWLDQVAENLGYDLVDLGKAICEEQGWSYDEDAESWDELYDSCSELEDLDLTYIQEPIDDMYPYFDYD